MSPRPCDQRLVTKTNVLHEAVEVARSVVDSRVMEDFATIFLSTKMKTWINRSDRTARLLYSRLPTYPQQGPSKP